MTLSELLRESAEKNGSRTALIFNEKKWSYLKLYEAVQKTAQAFRELGIKKGDKVALLLRNSPEFIFTVFGLSEVGGTAVPMNFLQKPEELEYICNHASVSGIVTQPDFLEAVGQMRSKIPTLKFVLCKEPIPPGVNFTVMSFSEILTKLVQKTAPESKKEESIILLYTSGTTGKPKGVMLSHANLTGNAIAAIHAFRLTREERFLCILPMFHIFSWTCNVLVPLHLGAMNVIVESIRPPKPWLKLMQTHQITVFEAVPQIYAVLAEQAKGIKGLVLKYLFFRTLRYCISGAAPLSREVFHTFQKKFNKTIYQGYGLTETSPLVSVNTPWAKKEGSVGKPIEGVQVKIIDAEEKVLPNGEEGEICIQGANVMQGYYKMPQETKASFTHDGWLKTGDIGVLDSEGFLSIRDRLKDMIIVKGLKVFSVQVEEVLLSHPAVLEAAVVGIPSADGDEIIKAFVVLKEGMQLDKQELFKLCQEKLPPYKKPRDIEFLKELPKNALQKVLKRELRKM